MGQTNDIEPKKKRANSVLKTSSSLIPIKGISSKMQKKLEALKIYDIPSLLSRCKDQPKRDKLAEDLEISPEHVNSWVKQGDLWRVEGMTTDTAYMLVLIGVRCVSDLSKVDPDKTYPILKSVSLSHPDFVLITKEELVSLISAAEAFNHSTVNLDYLLSWFGEIISCQDIPNDYVNQLLYDSICSNEYQFIEEEPRYLFRSILDHVDSNLANKLTAAWKDLFEYDCTLPLPKTISGTIKKRSIISNSQPTPFIGVKVEIDGVVSPAEDKTEAIKNPSCITDTTGHFIITLPERYNFKETIKIIISNARGKQEFIKNSADVINAVEENDIVSALQNILAKRIAYRATYIKEQSNPNATEELLDLKEEFWEAVNVLANKESKFKEKLEKLSIDKTIKQLKTIPISYEDNLFDKAIKEIFNTILSKATLEAKLEGIDTTEEDDSFIVTTEIFTGENTDLQKALPCVKLMGDDENPVMLSTDLAPSKMFTYSMLQRLIEPKLSKKNNEFERIKLNQPVDIDSFKEKLYKSTDDFPQMATLGLGYQLNMHQAWVPDGFALGDLLYSLILAPGEEQRLIVRENKQTYQITDTAQGSDLVTEDYENNQADDTTAVYDYAVSQLMDASSNYKTKSSSWSIGGSVSGGIGGFSLGLTGGYSSSSSSGSANARQSNSHNEASSAAQRFQQNIKTSSNRLAQAKRVSMSIATSDVSDSVATKIIANHNHSHAMTVQYWEVMKRYRLETAIDSVDLVLFVPLKLVNFLGNESFFYPENNYTKFSKTILCNRYNKLIKHANALEMSLPWKYRTGLELIRKYAATPNWAIEKLDTEEKTLTLTFSGNYLSFDDLSATLHLKNGKGCIGGQMSYSRQTIDEINNHIITSDALKSTIRNYRNQIGNVSVIVTFNLPSNVVSDDISYIQIHHSCEPLNYTLKLDPERDFSPAQYEAWLNYQDKEFDFAKDDDSSSKDLKKMAHYKELLPEAFTNPEVKLSPSTLKSLGLPSIHSVSITITGDKALSFSLSSSVIANRVSINVLSSEKTLRRTDFEKMEETFHHVVTDTLRYSQVIWSALTSDERAMLFDQYTIDMNFSKLRNQTGNDDTVDDKPISVPLLNCVNIRKVLGFYGNCMLLPFTFPKELADILGRTAVEVQDQLYRYHSNNFRAPTTIISMPTKGMIGEAVLGQTNVSEVIDLTRFWNWQDSPIDTMNIDSSYLNGTDYLAGKQTKDISSLGLQGVTPTTPVTAADLISALVGKQTPTFNNLTGQDQLAGIINKNTESVSTGRDNVINKASEMVNKCMELAQKQQQAETEAKKEIELEKLKNGSSSNSSGGNAENGNIGENVTDSEDGGTDDESEPDINNENSDGIDTENDSVSKENMVSMDSISSAFTKMKEFAEANPSATPEEFLSKVYNVEYNHGDIVNEAEKLLSDDASISDVVTFIKNIGKDE